MYPPVVIFNLL